MRSTPFSLLAALVAVTPGAARAQALDPVDYADAASWLCRPERQDACAVDLTTTVVQADGSTTTETYTANPSALIDCFYVYPTVSSDPTTNSDMTPNEAEFRVIEQQFARFGSVCRTYAPSYRQVTLRGLGGVTRDGGFSLDQGVAYDDVLDAFRHYLAQDNDGRGFVLVGHSQGSYILTRLIAEEVDGKPVQGRMVSALLIGAAPLVATGRDRGGSFQSIPLCRSSDQTGCVIAYSAFRSTVTPPQDSRFGIAPEPGVAVACTNPGALGGGSATLHSYLSGNGTTIVGPRPSPTWVAGDPAVETPFVSTPDLLTARCASNEYATYLEVTVNGDPRDPRADDIAGDLTPQWGLHLIDMNLAMGNLLDIVSRQAAAWR